MNWIEIVKAIILECQFKDWCGENYDLFHSGGVFPGIGTPRELFVMQQVLASIELANDPTVN